jgi:hypothetical protein
MGISFPPGLTDEKAARRLSALRDGQTLGKFGVKASRLETYFNGHPDYARKARPLIETNARAARLRKGDSLRTFTHCRAGLHLMVGDNIQIDGTHGRKRCRACRQMSAARPSVVDSSVIRAVEVALLAGASYGQICQGKPVGGGKRDGSLILISAKNFYHERQQNPAFDALVKQAISDSQKVGQRVRWARYWMRARTAAKQQESDDYHKILSMLPAFLPGRDDVAQDIFVALLDRSLTRSDVGARVKHYITEHNRRFPTKFAKFGNSPLVSLDEQMFEDGLTTLGDTITRGLWD